MCTRRHTDVHLTVGGGGLKLVKVKNQYKNQLNHPAFHTPCPLILNKMDTMMTKIKQIKCDLYMLYLE